MRNPLANTHTLYESAVKTHQARQRGMKTEQGQDVSIQKDTQRENSQNKTDTGRQGSKTQAITQRMDMEISNWNLTLQQKFMERETQPFKGDLYEISPLDAMHCI